MFEREFEFTVHYPIEECEERIKDLRVGGCLLRFFQPIIVHLIASKNEPYSEFSVLQVLGKNAGYAEIEGHIKQIKYDTTIVWGKVRLRNILFILILFTIIAFLMFMEGVLSQTWFLVGFVIIWYTLAWLQFIYFRNRLVKILEKSLMRPKKKK